MIFEIVFGMLQVMVGTVSVVLSMVGLLWYFFVRSDSDGSRTIQKDYPPAMINQKGKSMAESSMWLHKILIRVVLSWYRQNAGVMKDRIGQCIQEALSAPARGEPVQVKVNRCDLSDCVPDLSNIVSSNPFDKEFEMEFDLNYSGKLDFDMEAMLPLSLFGVPGFLSSGSIFVQFGVSKVEISGRVKMSWVSDNLSAERPIGAEREEGEGGENKHNISLSFVKPPSFKICLSSTIGQKVPVKNNKKVTELVGWAMARALEQITEPKMVSIPIDLTSAFAFKNNWAE